jgi:hypothetical protein
MAWTLANGPIPQNMNVLHRCDVPACVNPSHLFLGTHLDNMRDAAAKRRLSVPRPRRQRLTDFQVGEIFRLKALGVKQVELADLFRVTKGHISLVLSGKRRQFGKVAA